MALIEVFHVVATELPIDADVPSDIPQGILVSLNEDGNVVLANGAINMGNAGGIPIGIAADSRSSGVTSYTPESGSSLSRNPKTSLTGALVIGANGASQRFTQNRVADNYNEVVASGKMTVYHGGGEFWTDQYEIVDAAGNVNTFWPATPLYAAADEGISAVPIAGKDGLQSQDLVARPGRFTERAPAGNLQPIAAYTLTSPTSYPSGVPGTEVASFSGLGGGEGGNSLTFGTYLHLKLVL